MAIYRIWKTRNETVYKVFSLITFIQQPSSQEVDLVN